MLALDTIKSISSSEDEILLGIINLHNGGKPFDADVTYNVGGLYYENVPAPKLRFDLEPLMPGVMRADVCAIPLGNSSISSIVFDPPFMFNPHGSAKENKTVMRYTIFETWDELERTYRGALREFKRILKPGGIIAFKCQDYTDAETTMTHCLVYQWATELGFYAKDLFIRWRGSAPIIHNPKLKQRHARKTHSYWFVFQKS